MIPYNDRILLIDGILMTGSSRHLAPLIIIEVRIDDNIHRIDNDLGGSLAVHCIFEVYLLLKIHFPLNGIILDIVVNDVVMDVLIPQVELETTT